MTPEQEQAGCVDLGPVIALPEQEVEVVTERLVSVGFTWDDDENAWVLAPTLF